MIARTLFFSNPGHLGITRSQLVYTPARDASGNPGGDIRTIPVEDIGFIVIETQMMTITTYALQALAENNTAVIFCDKTHMPASQLLSFAGHTLTQKHFSAQIAASEALKARLWRQTVKSKIENQAQCLELGGKNGAQQIRSHLDKIKVSGDGNAEALAAKDYFQYHTASSGFRREREDGGILNSALNYGYAILRAATARALIGSGLNCAIGIKHCNQYNAFTLVDDVMEPYRPFVDDAVLNKQSFFPEDTLSLTKEMKALLLQTLVADTMIGSGNKMRRPLMNALTITSASLVRCFMKEQNEIEYPTFCRNRSEIEPEEDSA